MISVVLCNISWPRRLRQNSGNEKFVIAQLALLIVSLKFQVSAFIEIINIPDKFLRNLWCRSPQLESRSKFSCELCWNFENEFLWSRTSDAPVRISMFANSWNKSRLSIVLFFKEYSLVLEALNIAPNPTLNPNDLFLDIFWNIF